MLRVAILQPKALPAWIAISTTALFSAGSAPGRPRHTWQTCVFGGAPNAVGQPQKILLRVRSCACTSSPITGSQSCMAFAPAVACEAIVAVRFQPRAEVFGGARARVPRRARGEAAFPRRRT